MDLDERFELTRAVGEENWNIGDFQFIVRRSDGRVVVNDPTGLTFGFESWFTRGAARGDS